MPCRVQHRVQIGRYKRKERKKIRSHVCVICLRRRYDTPRLHTCVMRFRWFLEYLRLLGVYRLALMLPALRSRSRYKKQYNQSFYGAECRWLVGSTLFSNFPCSQGGLILTTADSRICSAMARRTSFSLLLQRYIYRLWSDYLTDYGVNIEAAHLTDVKCREKKVSYLHGTRARAQVQQRDAAKLRSVPCIRAVRDEGNLPRNIWYFFFETRNYPRSRVIFNAIKPRGEGQSAVLVLRQKGHSSMNDLRVERTIFTNLCITCNN